MSRRPDAPGSYMGVHGGHIGADPDQPDDAGALERVLARSATGRRMLESLDAIAHARVRWGLAQELANGAASAAGRCRSRISTANAAGDLLEAEVAHRGALHDLRRWSAEAAHWRATVERLEASLLLLADRQEQLL